MGDDRLRLWLSFWKWFLSSIVITGGIGVTTTVLDAKSQSTELQIKVINQEKEYLTSFLERALDENLEKRYRFAQYFSALTQTPSYKAGWEKYLSGIEYEIEETKQKVASIQATLEGISGEELESAKAEIEELKAQVAARRGGSFWPKPMAPRKPAAVSTDMTSSPPTSGARCDT